MASLFIGKGSACSFSTRSVKLPPLTSGRRATRLVTTSSSISSDHAERAKANAREGAEKAKEKAAAAKDWTAEEKTREGVGRAAEKSGEVKDRPAETARNAAETTEAGEKAKETVVGAWGAAKETAKKIKETVVGKDSASEVESGAARRRAAREGKVNRDID